MKKRILSIVLTLCMMLTLVPTVAFASDATYVVAGVPELCGKNWDGSVEGNEENIMASNGDGAVALRQPCKKKKQPGNQKKGCPVVAFMV